MVSQEKDRLEGLGPLTWTPNRGLVSEGGIRHFWDMGTPCSIFQKKSKHCLRDIDTPSKTQQTYN